MAAFPDWMPRPGPAPDRRLIGKVADTMGRTRYGATWMPRDSAIGTPIYQEAIAVLELLEQESGSDVSRVNRLLGVNLYDVRSFRADVRIDFDEVGRIRGASLLNVDQPDGPVRATPATLPASEGA